MHRDVANQIRGILKTFGLVLGKVAAGAFEARVRQLIAGNPLLVEVIEALLKVAPIGFAHLQAELTAGERIVASQKFRLVDTT
jgi:transposase